MSAKKFGTRFAKVVTVAAGVDATGGYIMWQSGLVLILAVGLLSREPVFAGEKCDSKLAADLVQMQKAQSTLLHNLTRKNLHFASTLEEMGAKNSRQRVPRSLFNETAQSFRDHHERELKLVEKFQEKSNNLLKALEECLPKDVLAVLSPARTQSQSAKIARE